MEGLGAKDFKPRVEIVGADELVDRKNLDGEVKIVVGWDGGDAERRLEFLKIG